MAGRRRVFGVAFTAKVALAAAKGDRTTAQLASQLGIHTSQVTAWEKQLLALHAPERSPAVPAGRLGAKQFVLRAARDAAENLILMRAIDCLYIKRPFFGTRKAREHFGINRKRAQRLMRQPGLTKPLAIEPRRRSTQRADATKAFALKSLLRRTQNDSDQQVVAKGLSTPLLAAARLLHRLVRPARAFTHDSATQQRHGCPGLRPTLPDDLRGHGNRRHR